MRADHGGRPPLTGDTPIGVTNMLKAAEENKVTEHKQDPIIQGRHVMPYFNNTPGKHIGEVTKAAYEAQTNGDFSNEDDGKKWLESHMNSRRLSSWKHVVVVLQK